jgi:hypothetical protein
MKSTTISPHEGRVDLLLGEGDVEEEFAVALVVVELLDELLGLHGLNGFDACKSAALLA